MSVDPDLADGATGTLGVEGIWGEEITGGFGDNGPVGELGGEALWVGAFKDFPSQPKPNEPIVLDIEEANPEAVSDDSNPLPNDPRKPSEVGLEIVMD